MSSDTNNFDDLEEAMRKLREALEVGMYVPPHDPTGGLRKTLVKLGIKSADRTALFEGLEATLKQVSFMDTKIKLLKDYITKET